MYPGPYAQQHPERPAVILAETGAQLTYAEFEARANRLAHFLEAQGLERLDHYAIFMENNLPYLKPAPLASAAASITPASMPI